MSVILKPTEEQIRIIESKGQVVVVNAGAGAAKTTTLEMLARAYPKLKMLYLAYNRSIKEEASKKFPPNVRVMTSHSPAYRTIGLKYEHKLQSNIRPYTVINALDLSKRSNVPQNAVSAYAQRIVQTIEKFLTTTNPYVELEDVVIDMGQPLERSYFKIADIANYANDIWGMMKDPTDTRIPMVHDGYLKLFMLSGAQIGRFDLLLFDEAQDANPVTMQIINNQQCRKMFVGDKNQAIYKFRGAINAMDMVPNAEHLRLSGSFRFGPEIARAANRILYLKDSDMYVKGLADPGIVVLPEGNYQIKGEPYMHISRGTYSMLEDVIQQVFSGKKVAFVGGAESYRFSRLDDVYALKFDLPVQDKFIAMFDSYDDLHAYASSDDEMAACISLVEAHGRELPSKIQKIKENTVLNFNDADILYSTAHKAKGLEHKNVVLSKDFNKIFNESVHFNQSGQRITYPEEEEMNVAYVGITRAKRQLVLPSEARALFMREDIALEMTASVVKKANPDSVNLHKRQRRSRAL